MNYPKCYILPQGWKERYSVINIHTGDINSSLKKRERETERNAIRMKRRERETERDAICMNRVPRIRDPVTMEVLFHV